MTITQKLTFTRPTKNTLVYTAPKGSAIDTLYIQKDALPPGEIEPPVITITVTA